MTTWMVVIAGAAVGGVIMLCGIIIGTLLGITVATRTMREIVGQEDFK